MRISFSISTLSIALCAVFVYLLTASSAYAQCPVPAASGGVKVNHAVCAPAGPGPCSGNPKAPGKDMCPCAISGTQGGSVTGQCMAGCCMRVSETSAQSAAQQGGFDPSQILGALQSLLMMGGGGGGGGGSAYMPPTYDSGSSILDDNLLSFDTGNILDSVNDFVFGGGNTAQDDTNDAVQQTGTSADGSVDPDAPVQEGDTVTTTYEYTETVADNPLVGDGLESETFVEATDGDDFIIGDGSDFDDDFFGADLDASDGTSEGGLGLSRELLEAQGLIEASRLGATSDTHAGSLKVPYESLTPAEIRSLQDYHSSAVAVSGRLSPFEGTQTAGEVVADTEPGFFGKIVSFFASLLGLGAPQQTQ